jgi:hypothetical protein
MRQLVTAGGTSVLRNVALGFKCGPCRGRKLWPLLQPEPRCPRSFLLHLPTAVPPLRGFAAQAQGPLPTGALLSPPQVRPLLPLTCPSPPLDPKRGHFASLCPQ